MSIMDNMRKHSAKLVEQALMVSQELVRVAILWNEMWFEGLEVNQLIIILIEQPIRY